MVTIYCTITTSRKTSIDLTLPSNDFKSNITHFTINGDHRKKLENCKKKKQEKPPPSGVE